MTDYIYLECIKEKSKLRVRIISPGYNTNANCQFPRAIRLEGRKYKVPSTNISVGTRAGQKFFYRVSKNNIEIIENADIKVKLEKVFKQPECCICMDAEPEIVIVKCGHLCLCKDCSKEYDSKRCPLCRGDIQQKIHKDQLE